MDTTQILIVATMAVAFVGFVMTILVLLSVSRRRDDEGALQNALREELQSELRESRKETANTLMMMTDMLQKSLSASFDRQDAAMGALSKGVNDNFRAVIESLKNFSVQQEQKLDNIRTTMENRLSALQEDNNRKLEKMRETVDEKLQKTLDDKLNKSFSMVSERLEQVYKGLGEMQTLATGVGDLKKVLSNVKTRGILGEIQLGAILEQMMSPEQYEQEITTKQGSRDHVEYAVKLPSDDG